jgi:hypothetical protein
VKGQAFDGQGKAPFAEGRQIQNLREREAPVQINWPDRPNFADFEKMAHPWAAAKLLAVSMRANSI